MVDTLVLGTSAKAWEFESLHAQIKGNDYRSFFYANFLFAHRPLTQVCCSVFATTGVLPCRVSCLVRLMQFAYDASESLHAQIKELISKLKMAPVLYRSHFYVLIPVLVHLIFVQTDTNKKVEISRQRDQQYQERHAFCA